MVYQLVDGRPSKSEVVGSNPVHRSLLTSKKKQVMSDRRYMVVMQSGRRFMVEEFGVSRTDWGNYNPATKQIEKVTSKSNEIIDESNTKITTENGFKNICMLDVGTSPLAFIDALDKSGVERFEDADFVTYLT